MRKLKLSDEQWEEILKQNQFVDNQHIINIVKLKYNVDVSEQTIYKKRRDLNLRKSTKIPQRRLSNDEWRQAIQENQNLSNKKIADEIKRKFNVEIHPNSVMFKRRKLGLYKNATNGPRPGEALKEIKQPPNKEIKQPPPDGHTIPEAGLSLSSAELQEIKNQLERLPERLSKKFDKLVQNIKDSVKANHHVNKELYNRAHEIACLNKRLKEIEKKLQSDIYDKDNLKKGK